MGPYLYITMESDLKPKSPCNMLFKYADDTNLAVPGITDVTLTDEFLHIKELAYHNKMIINESKTEEIVFRRPSPKRLHMFPSVDGIELDNVKLLGVILQNNFSVEMHVTYILSICSQRIFLLKRLHDQ